MGLTHGEQILEGHLIHTALIQSQQELWVFLLLQLSVDEANPDKSFLCQFTRFLARFFSRVQNRSLFRQITQEHFGFLQVFYVHALLVTVSHTAGKHASHVKGHVKGKMCIYHRLSLQIISMGRRILNTVCMYFSMRRQSINVSLSACELRSCSIACGMWLLLRQLQCSHLQCPWSCTTSCNLPTGSSFIRAEKQQDSCCTMCHMMMHGMNSCQYLRRL